MHLSANDTIQLLVESETTGKVTHTEDEQYVGEDTTDHGGLDNVEFTLDQSENGDEQLDGVTKRRVEQTSPGITEPAGELLCGITQTTGERHDAQERGDEDGHGVLVRKMHRP